MEKLIFETLATWSTQSKCQGSHVAAAAVHNNRLLGIGYNGTPRKTRNCDEVFKKVANGDKTEYYILFDSELDKWATEGNFNLKIMPDYSAMRNCTDYVGDKAKDLFNYLHGKWSTKYEVHAEMNLIFNLLKQGCNIPMDQVVIYTNISPCDQCLKNLAGLGVKEIHFKEVYWRSNPAELYQAAKRLNINLFYKGEPFLGSA